MSKTTKPLGLGKGLSAIFDTENLNTRAAITHSYEIDINKVAPNEGQPRTKFDDEAIEELAESIKRLGVIQPITVRQTEDGKFQIISGERRYRASLKAGLKNIPAYVRIVNDAELLEMALVENIQREELGALEIAFTLQRLIEELGLTQEALSQSVGKRRSTVANYLRLLSLSPAVQQALQNEAISMGHAKVIAGFENEEQQEELLGKIVAKKLSVHAAEEMVTAEKLAKRVKKVVQKSDYSSFAEPLEQVFGKRNVKIESKAKGGKISINFASDIELSQIVERLKN